MSVKIKRAGAKTAKALGLVFFLLLVVFNVQVATSNENSSDINLLGLSLSIFTPSAVASEIPQPTGIAKKTTEPAGDNCTAVTICCEDAVNPRNCSGDCVTFFQGSGCD